ncbi:hypothetical protein C8A05DRAFT_20318, partial [Staphylotrichum tortipilum]
MAAVAGPQHVLLAGPYLGNRDTLSCAPTQGVGAPDDPPSSPGSSGGSVYCDAVQSHDERGSDTETQVTQPSHPSAAASATSERGGDAETQATQPSKPSQPSAAASTTTSAPITAPYGDVWDDYKPVPGSKTKKLIFRRASFEGGPWTRDEWVTRFFFVARELEELVRTFLRLDDLTNRPVYDPRMVGTCPADARPAVVVTCCHADFKAIRNLFHAKAEGPLCLGNASTVSLLTSRFGLRTQETNPSIPRLQLVYFRTSGAPFTRNALSKPLLVALGTGSVACGGIIRYGARSATLGVALSVGGKIGLLTVDHLFPSGEFHQGEADELSSTFDVASSCPSLPSFSAYDDAEDEDLDLPFTDYGDDEGDEDLDLDFPFPDYEDDEYEDLDCPDAEPSGPLHHDSEVADATELFREEEPGREPAQWEWKLLANSANPANPGYLATQYLDWALTYPESTTLKASAICLNTIFTTGNGGGGVVLREMHEAPTSHLAPVYMVSGTRGILRGKILQTESLIPANHANQGPCQAWTMILDEPNGGILSGESGSVVVDSATNKVYGHVVGSGSQGHAYIVPLVRVLQQLSGLFG